MTSLVSSVIVTLAGLWLSYRFARERFSASTSLIAVGAVGAGSLVLWNLQRADLGGCLIMAVGSALAYGWSRLGRTQPPSRWTAAAVVLGLAGVAAWLRAPVRWMSPDLIDVLWASNGGLLATSPALYLALLGLACLYPLDRARALAGGILFAATTWLVGASDSWSAAAAPGPAPFAALVPYFVLGAAALVEWLARAIARRPGLAAGAGLASLVVWNVTLVDVAHDGGLRLGEPSSFGDLAAAQARVLHDWIGHPASYPASLFYAVRNRVAPRRFDLLRPNRLLADGATAGRLDIGAADDWFIGEGWHAPEREGDRTFRWATSVAELAVPLDRAADLTVAIDVRSFDLAGGQVQQLVVRINGAPQPAVALASGWQRLQLRVPSHAWRAGVNQVTLVFAAQGRPSDAGGGDTRWLAAAVDAILVSSLPSSSLSSLSSSF